MNLNLSGRMALVTGSSSALGLEIAKTLASNRAKMFICGRDEIALEKARTEIKSVYDVEIKVVDSSDSDSVYGYANWIEERWGCLDVLVNNIGGAPKFGKFEDLTDEDWQNTFDLNVMSAVRFTRAVLPLLRASRCGGRIINIGSLPGIQPGKFNPDYAVAKAGVHILTKCLANEFGPEGIRTNCICPSTLNGGGIMRNAKDRAKRERISVNEAKEKIIENAAKKNPLGQVGTLEDVANLVSFLASDAGQFINGVCIPVDGGECRSI